MLLHMSYGVGKLQIKVILLWSPYSDAAAMYPRYLFPAWSTLIFFILMHTVAVTIGRDMSVVLPSLSVLCGCDLV